MSKAFNDLAKGYEKFRPSYPQELFQALAARVYSSSDGVEHDGVVLDIGAGTGISTRQLRSIFDDTVPIIGIEPNDQMRHEAISAGHANNVCYLKGNASKLPFCENTISLVLAAQAIQWFDRREFYKECARIIRDNGILAIIQNNRLWNESTFLDAYEGFLESYSEGYSRHYRSFDILEELNHTDAFKLAERMSYKWQRAMSKTDFIGMANSSTKYEKAVKTHGAEFINKKLNDLLNSSFERNDNIEIPYETEFFVANKSET